MMFPPIYANVLENPQLLDPTFGYLLKHGLLTVNLANDLSSPKQPMGQPRLLFKLPGATYTDGEANEVGPSFIDISPKPLWASL